MKRIPQAFLFLLFLLTACKDKEESTEGKSENYLDAARNFIRAALDGKFSEARQYMLPDSVNINYMDVAERSYENAPDSIKNGYRVSTIRILDASKKLDDSTRVIIYSNTFKNDPDTLKVIRIKGNWLVDFKYLYLHDADTSVVAPSIFNDTIR